MQGLTIPPVEVAARLAVTAALMGLERETRGQSAGLRTRIVLGLGAALFTLVSAYGFPEFTDTALESNGRGVQFDPIRIAARIVTGVGFLGAGAILRQGADVRGLTTAASIWAAGAIGTAAGAGYYFGAGAATALVLATLYLLRGRRISTVSRFGTVFGGLGITFEGTGRRISDATEILKELSALPNVKRVAVTGLQEVE